MIVAFNNLWNIRLEGNGCHMHWRCGAGRHGMMEATATVTPDVTV